jgi:hypothetical protein
VGVRARAGCCGCEKLVLAARRQHAPQPRCSLQRCTDPVVCARAAAPGSIPPINMTSSSGVVFSFNYWMRATVDAQKHCNQQGGHLASYSSMLEQNEVEQAFVAGVSLAASPQAQH